jgi:hypothetical protein
MEEAKTQIIVDKLRAGGGVLASYFVLGALGHGGGGGVSASSQGVVAGCLCTPSWFNKPPSSS